MAVHGALSELNLPTLDFRCFYSRKILTTALKEPCSSSKRVKFSIQSKIRIGLKIVFRVYYQEVSTK